MQKVERCESASKGVSQTIKEKIAGESLLYCSSGYASVSKVFIFPPHLTLLLFLEVVMDKRIGWNSPRMRYLNGDGR